ncbi:MAG: methylmalonyl Co-A mutase-associated GTPase MeaB [Schleiferiaceae bacterium]
MAVNKGGLNPKLFKQVSKPATLSADEYVKGILAGDAMLLGRAITLVESQKLEDLEIAQEVIEKCLPHSGNSIRLGITGIPGVGKSSWIESMGKYLIDEHGKKVAVLAVDPSSGISGGSILGDKTRMEELTQDPNAFIRPSPSAGSLGGVARKTRESIILCEAAGYDTLFIETVGVGQSETAVAEMVDLFVLLLITGAGDELQGIKRGIMEMADIVLLNKADGDNALKAKKAAAEVKRALHLFPLDEREWVVPVGTTSAHEKMGLDNAWELIEKYQRHMNTKGLWEQRRRDQNAHWLKDTTEEIWLQTLYNTPGMAEAYAEELKRVSEGKASPYAAALRLIQREREK